MPGSWVLVWLRTLDASGRERAVLCLLRKGTPIDYLAERLHPVAIVAALLSCLATRALHIAACSLL